MAIIWVDKLEGDLQCHVLYSQWVTLCSMWMQNFLDTNLNQKMFNWCCIIQVVTFVQFFLNYQPFKLFHGNKLPVYIWPNLLVYMKLKLKWSPGVLFCLQVNRLLMTQWKMRMKIDVPEETHLIATIVCARWRHLVQNFFTFLNFL